MSNLETLKLRFFLVYGNQQASKSHVTLMLASCLMFEVQVSTSRTQSSHKRVAANFFHQIQSYIKHTFTSQIFIIERKVCLIQLGDYKNY